MLLKDPEQLLIFITGISGSGKMHVIKAILDVFLKLSKYQEILVSAPTGSAACLIDGYTIHALTLMGVGSQFGVRETLTSGSEGHPGKQKINIDELQEIWRDIKYLVLDEVSMVSAELLTSIADRLSVAKSGNPSAKDKLFGGINMIFAGDMAQLKPVKGTALYLYAIVKNLSSFSFKTVKSQQCLFGAYLWRSLTHVVQLLKNERAKTDPDFIELLERFVSIKESKDYLGRLPLMPGMPILITENLALAGKIVNGARGTIKHIAYDLIGSKRVARCVYVEVPGSTLQLPGEHQHIVAVFPRSITFKYTSKNNIKFNVSCRQVPIVPGWAFTDYKAQGASLPTAIIDLTTARNVQHAYVMLSGATSLNKLAILQKFSSQRALGHLSKDLGDELQRLAVMDNETKKTFLNTHPNLIPSHPL